MKTKAGLLCLLLVSFAVLYSARAQTDLEPSQPAASTGGLSGTCGFTLVSTNVDSTSGHFLVPDSTVGTMAFNTLGQVVGNITTNKHGTVTSTSPVNGTYVINADGRTGTIDFNTLNPGFPVLKFALTTSATELRFINVGPTDPATGIINDVTAGVCKF